MAGVKTRGATAGIFPYNPQKRHNKAKGSEHERGKARAIALSAASAYRPILQKETEEWARLHAAGLATKRKPNGSYYILPANKSPEEIKAIRTGMVEE